MNAMIRLQMKFHKLIVSKINFIIFILNEHWDINIIIIKFNHY